MYILRSLFFSKVLLYFETPYLAFNVDFEIPNAASLRIAEARRALAKAGLDSGNEE